MRGWLCGTLLEFRIILHIHNEGKGFSQGINTKII